MKSVCGPGDGSAGGGGGSGDTTETGAGFSLVVTRILLILDELPAESNAATPNVYFVEGESRMKPWMVLTVVPINALSW